MPVFDRPLVMIALQIGLLPLLPLLWSVLYLRRSLYRWGFLKSYHLPVPVISVGNHSFGGTGKTPVVHYIADFLISKGYRVGIICRNYKAKQGTATQDKTKANEAMEILKLDGESVALQGDEASLLKFKIPEARVFSGPNKLRTAQKFITKSEFDVVIIDDGFQHLALHRDLNILLVDSSDSHWGLFPFGRGRESLPQVEGDADIVWITKCDPKWKKSIQQRLTMMGCRREPDLWSDTQYSSDDIERLQKAKDCIAISALARNDLFFQAVDEWKPLDEDQCFSFPDHHAFTREEIENCLSGHAGDAQIICTEKDAVKLRSLVDNQNSLLVLPVHVRIWDGKEKLDEKILKVLH